MAESEIYLFTGPEAGEKNDAIDTLRQTAEKKNGSVDFYRYYASETRVQDVVAQLQNVSLFSSSLFIELKNAELIKGKSDVEALSEWAKGGAKESPNVLVLVSDENSIDKKIESLVPSSHKKIFWEMFENRKSQWLQGFFRKNGFSVTADAVDQILDMVENNTEALKSECSRFFYCFEPGHTVTVDDVDKILSHNREENAFTLFEAMAEAGKSPRQRFETSMEILQKIRLSRDSGGVAIIAGLSYCYRQLRTWHSLHAKGASPTDVQLKSAGLGGKKNVERYANAARIWGPGATSSVIALLAHTDMNIRENGTAMEDTNLAMMVYSIVMKNGLFCAEY